MKSLRFEVKGLYLADGSIFPASAGINPMLPIMALADSAMPGMAPAILAYHAMLGDAFGWVGRPDEIAVPTLIIHGTEDPVLPYAHALALKSAIAGSSLLTLIRPT